MTSEREGGERGKGMHTVVLDENLLVGDPVNIIDVGLAHTRRHQLEVMLLTRTAEENEGIRECVKKERARKR